VSQDKNRALELHKKYGTNERVVKHCETVTKVAEILVEALKERGTQLDERAVVTAAMLHDLGRNKTQTVHHGFVGAQIVEEEGLDGAVSGIIRRHVGAGISKEEAVQLGFPEGDYIPRTLEERLVCFADKMVHGDRIRPFEQEVRRFAAKGHDVARLNKLKEGLEQVLGSDPEQIIFSKLRG